MEILLEKEDGDGNFILNKFPFIAKAQTLTNKTVMTNTIQIINENIQNRIDQFTNNGSGWVISAITRHFLSVNKYSPLAAKSYIKLPDTITNRKATINIQNDDDKCFMYCLGRALDPNPEKHHLERVNQHLKDVCHKLGLDQIKMPVSVKDIPKIEQDFNISINVFGYNGPDTNGIYLPNFINKINRQKTC